MKHETNKEIYSRAELEEMIREMEAISEHFYWNAVKVRNHAFIEFCGLMNEYIQMCRDTMLAGGDFTQCNVHSGRSLSVAEHQGAYLAEKFECIFGPTLRSNPRIARDFVRGVIGNPHITESAAMALAESEAP